MRGNPKNLNSDTPVCASEKSYPLNEIDKLVRIIPVGTVYAATSGIENVSSCGDTTATCLCA